MMASVIKDPNGRKRIQFGASDGRRRTIRLGRVELRHAHAVRVKVEAMVSASLTQQPLDMQTSEWVANLDDGLHQKLVAVGLVKARQGRTLGAWLETFLDSRSDLKPESRRKLRQTQAKLIAYFGEDHPLHLVTPDEAAEWREGLKTTGLSEAAVKTHTGNAKTMFADAVRRELVAKSPFAHLKGGVTPTRNTRYVTPEEAIRVLEACPNTEW